MRDSHPGIEGLAGWCAVGAVGMTAMDGFVAAYRMLSIAAALRVGVWSGLISGVIALATLVCVVGLFHDALMKDPSNIREFARSVHRAPTEAELSRFIYADAVAGGVNHAWIGPLLGVTVGGIGAVMGKMVRRSDDVARAAKTWDLRSR